MSELLNPDRPIDVARPMRADARRNRAAILKAARELFASEDPEVQMDDVARRAGVGVGTVYRHFPDKEALMGELVRERFLQFNERLEEALADERSAPFDALAGALRDNAASVAEDAATRFAFMSGGERVFSHAEAEKEEFMRLAIPLVQRAKDAGELQPDFQATDIPMIMCGVCASIDKRSGGWDWRRHLELILRGMRTGG
ncbi:MAG TPA: helix-turn-helix domain-containing protein [Solirubrobacteraceae bacterium]|jgi:AcrR family transcriptional regulator|nr:helix-turn-helix domain-containing protein [Solirubrobacteraceae bacterium]